MKSYSKHCFLLLFTIMILKFVCVAFINGSFLYITENQFIERMDHSLSVRSPAEEHLDCSQFLAVTNRAATNIYVQVFKNFSKNGGVESLMKHRGSLFLCLGFLQLQEARLLSSCGVEASRCGGFSCCGAWASVVAACRLWKCVGSVVEAHRPSCPKACGISIPEPGWIPCPLYWQADS